MSVSIDSVEDEIAVEKYAEIQRYVPPLYVSLIVTAILLSFTHFGLAPSYLPVYAPGILVTFMLLRLCIWVARSDVTVSAMKARRALRGLRGFAVIIAVLTLTWALTLFRYGTGIESGHMTTEGHVVLYVGLTVLSCIFLLKHEPVAAVTLAVIVMLPFCTFLIVQGGPIEKAVSINLTIVTAAMVYVVLKFGREFRRMVKTRLEMATVSAENERLAHTDQITGLASRRAFFVRLADLFAQQRDYVILTIDLDGFKLLNDHHGHIFGDDVLAEVGKRIANIVGEHNPARLG